MLHRLRPYAIAAILLLLAMVLASEAWWHGASRRGEAACEAPRAVAVVFYAGHPAEDGRRLDAAADLWRRSCVDRIALVGGDRPARGFNGSRENVSILVERGVSRDRIVLGAGSFDSRTNLDEMTAIFDRDGWTSGVLVSDCLHLDRLARLAADLTAYPLDRHCGPPPGMGVRLWRTGYEVAAYASSALPPDWRSWIVRRLRAQSSPSDESLPHE